MKILCVGDIHLSDRPPSSCTETYQDDLFDLLEQTVTLAKERSCEAVVWAGDVFHSKIPARTSHRTMQRAIQLVQSYSCQLYIVPGNHDMANDRETSVLDSQPLGVLLRSGARLLKGWADVLSWDGDQELSPLPLYGVPWLADWNSRDSEGEPSIHAMRAVEDALVGFNVRRTLDKTTPVLLVTHAPFYPPGTELPYEFFPVGVFAAAMENRGSCYYGHVHEAHGIYEVDGVRFCNAGALSRGSLHEYNRTREISVTVWDSETGEFTMIPLDYKPADQVLRVEESRKVKEAQQTLDAFLQSIGETRIEITSAEAVVEHYRSMGLDAGLLKVLEELIATASGR